MGLPAGFSRSLKRHPVGLTLLLIFTLYFVVRLINIRAVPVHIDEAIYLNWARDAQHGQLWASLLWDGKPPLHPWAMVPFLGLFSDPLVAGRMASVFFGALTTLGMFLIGREFRDWRFGALAALLYVVCPYTLWYDRLAITESMLLSLFVFSIYFAVKAAKSVNSLYLIGAGVATGLALWTKGTAMLIYPIMFFAYLVRGPREKGMENKRPLLRWIVAVTLSLLLGFALQNLLRLSPKYAARSHFIGTRTRGFGEVVESPLRYFFKFNLSILGSMLKYLTPALLLIAFLGLLLSLINRWRPGYFSWMWLLIGVVVISLVGRFTWPRFYLVLVPPLLFSATYALFVLAGFLAKAWGERRETGKKLVAAVSVVTLAILLTAVAAPVGLQLNGMMNGKQGVPQFLSGRTAGLGMTETVDILRRRSQNQEIDVVVNDYFIHLALLMYLDQDHNLQIISLNNEYRKGYTRRLKETIEKASLQRPTYLIVNGFSHLPSSWQLKVIEAFNKDSNERKSSMFLTRVVDVSHHR